MIQQRKLTPYHNGKSFFYAVFLRADDRCGGADVMIYESSFSGRALIFRGFPPVHWQHREGVCFPPMAPFHKLPSRTVFLKNPP
jgi:hypothetical protein